MAGSSKLLQNNSRVEAALAFNRLIIITFPISIKKMTSDPNGPLVHFCTPECGLIVCFRRSLQLSASFWSVIGKAWILACGIYVKYLAAYVKSLNKLPVNGVEGKREKEIHDLKLHLSQNIMEDGED